MGKNGLDIQVEKKPDVKNIADEVVYINMQNCMIKMKYIISTEVTQIKRKKKR